MFLTKRVVVPGDLPNGTKILCYSEAWGQGGIESFLMELFRNLQGKGFSFSVFSTWDWNLKLDGELLKMRVPRWTVFPDHRPDQLTRIKKGPVAFKQLIREIKPDAVYINTMNGMGFRFSKMAKDMGVPVRVIHSHNSAFGSGFSIAKSAAHDFGRRLWADTATVRLAVSSDAGAYLFGSRSYRVVNNGIDTKRFAFDAGKRMEFRDALDIPKNVLVFGSIGRIAEAKNPLYQIRTFAEIKKLIPDSLYLMVGEGDMQLQVESLISELNLKDSVIKPGYFIDSSPIYSALDCFLMPSLHEGLPLASIEAQAAGLPILCSEGLAEEAHVTDLEKRLSLSDGEDMWARTAAKMACTKRNRSCYAEMVRAAHFDASDTANYLARVFQQVER